MSKQIVKVPDLGGASDVEVIEVCVYNGDVVTVEQSLLVVESDKASMDIPSPFSGTIISIAVSEGASIAEGDVILELELADGTAEDSASSELSSTEAESSLPELVTDVSSDKNSSSSSNANISAEGSVQTTTEPVMMPDLGGADQVEVIEISVAVGDEVAEGDSLLVMESDKASMDLPSPRAGIVKVLHVKEGDMLAQGDLVLDLEGGASEVQPSKPATKVNSEAEPAKTVVSDPLESSSTSSADRRRKTDIYAGPAVRKLARELGVDLSRVKGSGPRERIAKEDLYSFVKKAVSEPSTMAGAIPKVPEIDFSPFGETEVQPMTRLHKITAANMHRSWLNVPHVTQFDEADITELEVFRASLKPEMEQRGIKISPLPFILKSVATALRAHKGFNSSLAFDGESIIYKKYVHIGMAVDTPEGLMVPVIRDVDKKGIWELSEEIVELANKAKNRKLKPAEMSGGCFTISSLGAIGGTGFTPIINSPEVAILGVSKLAIKPVYVNGNLEPRKMLPLSLSYDHRVVNGGDAGRFFTFLSSMLSDVRRLAL